MIPGDGAYRSRSRSFDHERSYFEAGDDELREKDTKSLLGELVEEGRQLVREEVRLAKSELKDDVAQLGTGAGLFGAAGVVGLLALMSLTAAIIAALSLVMPVWGAAAIVGILLAGVAVVLGLAGKSTIASVRVLDETMESVKEDKEWASETMRATRSNSRANA